MPQASSEQKQLLAVRRACRKDLVAWFVARQRMLPWRRKRTPYRVWVAEIMLQQTRVLQALPYYDRFMKRFPSLKALAAASRQEVLKQWEGLGYYARARRLHETARYLVCESGGRFPRTYDGLLALPGIGPYTAAAIGSLAMGLDVAVVDGNVSRVLARLFMLKESVGTTAAKRQLQLWADELMMPGQAARSNEAFMELGALCCMTTKPTCLDCPLRRVCRAFAEGCPERYPVKKRRKTIPHKVVGAGVIINRKGEVLLAQRLEDDMLGGLWEFPGGTQKPGETVKACIARELREELGINVRVGSHVITVDHAYSHFTMELHAHWVRIRTGRPRPIECADVAWVSVGRMKELPMSKADVRVRQVVEQSEVPR